MYTSSNLILHSLSCLVLDRFAAVGTKYEILSILQSGRDIKILIRNLFAVNMYSFSFFVLFFYTILCVF